MKPSAVGHRFAGVLCVRHDADDSLGFACGCFVSFPGDEVVLTPCRIGCPVMREVEDMARDEGKPIQYVRLS